MADFFWFSDLQWARIEPRLPMDVRGKKRVDDRPVLSGIVHALKCGGRWADCADVYGPKKTLYNRFVRWAERGIWEDIFSALAGTQDTPDRLFIDSSCIKVHRGWKRGAFAHGIGRTKGGSNSKLHAVCDEKGRWAVVHDICLQAYQSIRVAFPCAEVNIANGLEQGFVVLETPSSATHVLVVPTTRISGIESPALLSETAQNYWKVEWDPRRFVEEGA